MKAENKKNLGEQKQYIFGSNRFEIRTKNFLFEYVYCIEPINESFLYDLNY